MTVIENNLHTLVANFNKETFIYDLPTAYGTPKSTISKIEGSDHDKMPEGLRKAHHALDKAIE